MAYLLPRVRVRRWVSHAADALAGVFLPAGCRLCEKLLTSATRIPVCEECLDSFARLPARICAKCGEPLAEGFQNDGFSPQEAGGTGEICRLCESRMYAFDRARSYGLYKDALARAIVMLKFEQIVPLGRWFAERLFEVMVADGALAVDIVVPVPLHLRRERERGYNQVELVAKPLAQGLKVPYRPVLLVRKRPRPDKHILTLRERWDSVRGAFATYPGTRVDNLRVLLVDDVLTTGATLDACAKTLREAGAKSVIGLTIARAARRPMVDSASTRRTGDERRTTRSA
jgi:competence protein ComFC